MYCISWTGHFGFGNVLSNVVIQQKWPQKMINSWSSVPSTQFHFINLNSLTAFQVVLKTIVSSMLSPEWDELAHTQISGPRRMLQLHKWLTAIWPGVCATRRAATCVTTNNPTMSKDRQRVFVRVSVYIISGRIRDIRPPRRCLMPSRWSLLRLPLNLCSKLERNPGGLTGALCTAEHVPHLHLQRFKNRWAGSSPPTLYPPPVKPILAGEPVPELLIQSKYETSCTSEVHSHVSNVYFYLCHSPSL